MRAPAPSAARRPAPPPGLTLPLRRPSKQREGEMNHGAAPEQRGARVRSYLLLLPRLPWRGPVVPLRSSAGGDWLPRAEREAECRGLRFSAFTTASPRRRRRSRRRSAASSMAPLPPPALRPEALLPARPRPRSRPGPAPGPPHPSTPPSAPPSGPGPAPPPARPLLRRRPARASAVAIATQRQSPR